MDYKPDEPDLKARNEKKIEVWKTPRGKYKDRN
jgi:hypothetical protein